MKSPFISYYYSTNAEKLGYWSGVGVGIGSGLPHSLLRILVGELLFPSGAAANTENFASFANCVAEAIVYFEITAITFFQDGF